MKFIKYKQVARIGGIALYGFDNLYNVNANYVKIYVFTEVTEPLKLIAHSIF